MMRTTVIIVGPGRLGRSVATLLERRQVPVQLVGRHDRIPPAAITYLTVPDREIGEAAARVPKGGVVLHASGASDVEVLRPHEKAGSLHPLMTFPGPEIALPSGVIPAAIAGDPEAVTAARKLAELIGFVPFEVQGDRALYHAAAVTAGNFATVLLHQACTMLAAAGVPLADAPGLLAPLALNSIHNAALFGAAATLTGPVARGDEISIQGHQAALSAFPEHTRAVYGALLTAARSLHRGENNKE
jgi:predicted short-subunit dehydrogenase-like oxidoreductase (DUF2520 family)